MDSRSPVETLSAWYLGAGRRALCRRPKPLTVPGWRRSLPQSQFSGRLVGERRLKAVETVLQETGGARDRYR